jgi:cytochrome c biogenesis protein CcmG/thiol:disulfide interchange protein DsbE
VNEPQARGLAKNLILAGVGLLVVGLALVEFRARGTGGVTGTSIADYAAEAEVQATPAPNFTLPSLQGVGTFSLRPYRGSVVVLNFWATWCLPCRKEAPGLQRTWETYRGRGVRFLGVAERDDDAAGRAFVNEFEITYPSASDQSGTLADDYRLFGMPTTFVIDRNGTIRYRFVGYVTEDALRGALDHLVGKEQA